MTIFCQSVNKLPCSYTNTFLFWCKAGSVEFISYWKLFAYVKSILCMYRYSRTKKKVPEHQCYIHTNHPKKKGVPDVHCVCVLLLLLLLNTSLNDSGTIAEKQPCQMNRIFATDPIWTWGSCSSCIFLHYLWLHLCAH